VAVDQRLRDAAGPSLRYYGTRKHTAREQVRGELLASRPPVGRWRRRRTAWAG